MTLPETTHWNEDLALIVEAARAAGNIALGFFGQSPEVWWKNEGRSPVSAADFAANDRLSSILKAARPDYGWLSEENDDDPERLTRDTVFIVDPIDGTRGFIAGMKTWCVSVAVVHRGRPVAGVLYAPALDEEFAAVVGGAATLNGRPVAVSQPEPGEKLKIAAAEDTMDAIDPAFRVTLERVKHIPSLAYRIAIVADGRIDGTFVKRNAHDWDLAAADLILEQAGGSLADLDGRRLVYNRPDVRHGVLCAAGDGALPALLQHAAGSRKS